MPQTQSEKPINHQHNPTRIMKQEIDEPLSPVLIETQSDSEIFVLENSKKKRRVASYASEPKHTQPLSRSIIQVKLDSDSDSDSDFEQYFPKNKNIKRKRLPTPKPIQTSPSGWIKKRCLRNSRQNALKVKDHVPLPRKEAIEDVLDLTWSDEE